MTGKPGHRVSPLTVAFPSIPAIGGVEMAVGRAGLEVGVDVGVSAGAAVMWTCTLTKRYVEINGDYRS